MITRPTPETDAAEERAMSGISSMAEGRRNQAQTLGLLCRALERQRDEAIELLRGMWSIPGSVTLAQERELKDEWHPKVRAFLARIDKERQA